MVRRPSRSTEADSRGGRCGEAEAVGWYDASRRVGSSRCPIGPRRVARKRKASCDPQSMFEHMGPTTHKPHAPLHFALLDFLVSVRSRLPFRRV